MTCAIIDYGSGNLRSAEKAFLRAAHGRENGHGVVVTADPDVVAEADRVVVPGVGAFADCMDGLSEVDGMIDALQEAVRVKGRPMLGICVGMQLFATRGLEHKTSPGLDWVAGDVRRLEPADTTLKIPHMGWNVLQDIADHPVLAGIPGGADGWHAYFVHSYVIEPKDASQVLARAEHGEAFAAVVGHDNIIGTQFHPEKSQQLGLRLIENFLDWAP